MRRVICRNTAFISGESTLSAALHEVNQVLHGTDPYNADLNNSVFATLPESTPEDMSSKTQSVNGTQSVGREPTMSDVMGCLMRVEARVIGVEKRLETLE